jgi:uncharacterized protein YndB with AHSA1/START domain
MPIKLQITETIAAPPERVYEALTDLDDAKRWMKGLKSIEKLTQGPFGPGTKWRETRKFMGHQASEVFEVIAAEPSQRLEIFCDGKSGTSKRGHYRFTYVLKPDGEGTRLELLGEISQVGWFGELLGRLFAGLYKSAIARDITALKQTLESAKS